MKWFRRKEPELPTEDPRTPCANIVRRMAMGGWTLDAIVLELASHEISDYVRFKAILLRTAQASAIASPPASAPSVDKKRAKWRRQKQEQRKKAKAKTRPKLVALSAGMSAGKSGQERDKGSG